MTDSVVLADASDGVLIVMAADKSTRRDLKRLMAIYETAEVPVLGAVLNRGEVARAQRVLLRLQVAAPASSRSSLSRRARRKEAKASG